ncbi:MAG: hypothetical protein AB7O96_10280 [Pseudobdellovibrionaceae bacterium]
MNSDISVQGIGFHVQTEDWGHANPFIVSRVFKNGAVVKSIKTSYMEALKSGPRSDREAIQLAIHHQHSQILDLVLSGQLLKP